MASTLPSPELSGGAASPANIPPKPQRVLACVLCQQRKVKCDRRFPCANCTKAGAQCVPAALIPRQRRRRFPERDLLERVRHYESLLREYHIPFEPLHGKPTDAAPDPENHVHQDRDHNQDTGDRPVHEFERQDGAEVTEFRPANFWHAMNRRSQDSDNDDSNESDPDSRNDASLYVLREKVVKNAWEELYLGNDHLLFCSPNTAIQIESLHPSQAQIFKLWQVYLDRVNPLLRVTHTPTLQPRIIDAATDITNIDPALEALMFSIYCVAVFSLDQEECRSLFGTPRHDVLRGYQLGVREALMRCDFLKTRKMESLIALHLYQMTIKPDVDPRSQSSILGVTMRIAQRLGIHTESMNVKHNILEAEMRRRLWWSLVLFDARMSEMTDLRLSHLVPTWDCKKPINVNDFDLRSEMKTLPIVHPQPSEALFAVLRSEIGDFTRHDPGHLDFVNPVLKVFSKKRTVSVTDVGDLDALESMLESKYLRLCDTETPIHYMAVWTTRVAIAKTRFIRFLATTSRMTTTEKDHCRDMGASIARRMLQCDAKLMQSPLTRQYRWHIFLHFPFPAYVHIVQDLKERPIGDHADKGWIAMTENSAARLHHMDNKDNPMEKKNNPFYKIFAGLVLQAWSAREAAVGAGEEPPAIVSQIKRRIAELQASKDEGEQPTPEPMEFGNFETFFDMGATHHNMIPSPDSFGASATRFENSPWAWQAPSWNSIPEPW